ncbi:eukaryotic translation initiation factor 3 subunit M isoform X1 [Capsicum galapagoense]
MTTVVPTSEEDPVISVVRFTAEMSWADAGAEIAEPQVNRLCVEAQECMIEGRWLDLASLMLTSADLIFSKASEKDLECIFTIICNLVKKPESLDQVHEMAELISTKIIQQPNDKPALRLKILFNLYNLLENPYSRFFVYLKSLNLASHGKVTEHILPSIKKMDNFFKEWNLGVNDQRELFLAISNVLKDNKGSAKDSFMFLTKYLETFSSEDASNMNEAKEEAARAIIDFVRSPDMFKCDLLDMPAIAQLEKDAKYAPVYQLLKIFLTQRLDAFLDFEAANSELLKSYGNVFTCTGQAFHLGHVLKLLVNAIGLVHDDCISKMRLMSLVDLGLNESSQIPYSVIREALQIDDTEVESWVVKAITAKLLDCKIDQMNQVVIVSRCTERVFGVHQWQELRTKLMTWRGNIAGVISTVQANKITEDNTQAMQGLAIR